MENTYQETSGNIFQSDDEFNPEGHHPSFFMNEEPLPEAAQRSLQEWRGEEVPEVAPELETPFQKSYRASIEGTGFLAAGRAAERLIERSEIPADAGWEFTVDDERGLLDDGYSTDDIDYLKKAKSREEFIKLQSYIAQDKQRNEDLNAAGSTVGTVNQVMAAIGGSVLLPAFSPATSSRAGAVALGIAEEAVLEGGAYLGDTQAEVANVLFAMATGGITMGLLNPTKPRNVKNVPEAAETPVFNKTEYIEPDGVIQDMAKIQVEKMGVNPDTLQPLPKKKKKPKKKKGGKTKTQRRKERKKQFDEVFTPKEGEAKSVGAAAAEKELYELSDEERYILDDFDEWGQEAGVDDFDARYYKAADTPVIKQFVSTYNKLMAVDSSEFRGFINRLLENPTQASKHMTVASKKNIVDRELRSIGMPEYRAAQEAWGKAKHGNSTKSYMARVMNGDDEAEFHKAVMSQLDNPQAITGPVKDAADALAKTYSKAYDMASEAGVVGFKKGKKKPNYVPKILRDENVYNAVRTYGEDRVKRLISKGYQQGYYELSPAAADAIAADRIAASKQATLGPDNAGTRSPKVEDLEKVVKDLRAAEAPEEVIEDFVNRSIRQEELEGMSNRAKKSLDPDLSVEDGDLKLVDLMVHDQTRLMEDYLREMSPLIALAKVMNIKSEVQFTKVTRMLEKWMRNDKGLDEAKIDELVTILEDTRKIMFGRSINPSERWRSNLATFRAYTAMLRLGMAGFSTAAEHFRVIGSNGLSSYLSAIPMMRNKKVMSELNSIMPNVGDDWKLSARSIDPELYEDTVVGGKIANILTRAVANGQDTFGLVTGLRHVQGVGEKMSANAIVKNLQSGKFNQAHAKRAGWTDEQFNDIKAHIDKRKEGEVLGFDRMPFDMQENVKNGINRLVKRDMLKMMDGESSEFLSKTAGQTLLQFRSFPIASIEKQMLHDIKAGDAMALQTFVWSLFGSGALLGARAGYKDMFDDGDRFDKLADKPAAWALNALMASGAGSGLSLPVDALASVGAIPDELMVDSGFRTVRGQGLNGVASVGVLSDAQTTAMDFFKVVSGAESLGQSGLANDVMGLVPMAGTLNLHKAVQAVMED